MNNSDNNDFNNWQNGDEFEMNNPNNMGGFFFFGSPQFKDLWKKMQNKENINDDLRDYLNMDDLLNQYGKQMNPKGPHRRNPKKNQKQTTFTQDEYQKLIEIRGYLAITEQHAHVKALDKMLNQIIMIPIDPRGK